MRFAVESWAPDYGAPLDLPEAGDGEDGGQVDASVEVPAASWQPIRSQSSPARTVVFASSTSA